MPPKKKKGAASKNATPKIQQDKEEVKEPAAKRQKLNNGKDHAHFDLEEHAKGHGHARCIWATSDKSYPKETIQPVGFKRAKDKVDFTPKMKEHQKIMTESGCDLEKLTDIRRHIH